VVKILASKTPIRQAAFYISHCCYLTKFNKSGYPFWPFLGTYLTIHGNSNVHGKILPNSLKQLQQPFSDINFNDSHVTIPQIFTRSRGPLAALAHEDGSPDYISSSPQFIWGIENRSIQASRELALRHPSDQAFTSHNTAILDVGFLLSGGPEPV
jgi:hypothetical protein